VNVHGRFAVSAGLVFMVACWAAAAASGQSVLDIAPAALSTLAVPEPANLMDYVADRDAAIRLGKALFWDMQVGSDVQACASCHFHAGADSRAKNQVSPGLLAADETFQVMGPNGTVQAADFPFHRLQDPDTRTGRGGVLLSDANDVVSSQGVFLSMLISVRRRGEDRVRFLDDPVFNVNGVTVRRVEPRNTPTTINAVFNMENFWDGRAKNVFNGANPFGALDTESTVIVNDNGVLELQFVRLLDSSLASQAVGPPGSDFEMSAQTRSFAEIGKKLLGRRPLAKQRVHPDDSLLGPLAQARLDRQGRVTGPRGLRVRTYAEMVREAFRPEFWDSPFIFILGPDGRLTEPQPGDPRRFFIGGRNFVRDEFTQMEANFALFFGLAVQMYEATLVSDQARYDQAKLGLLELTAEELDGLDTFLNRGGCIECHAGPLFTNASIPHQRGGLGEPPDPDEPGGEGVEGPIELMAMATGAAFYDTGFYNVSVRPTAEDRGRGGTAPFLNPLTGQPYPLSFSRLALLKRHGLLPAEVVAFVPDLPIGSGIPDPERIAVDGAMKAPGLRNVELTGPYFHNGGDATLRQVIDLYTRGGNFHEVNIDNLDLGINVIGGMDEQRKDNLVAFLLTLTDERVRNEQAPFDHPELFIPGGTAGDENAVARRGNTPRGLGFQRTEDVITLPAVGAAGRPAEGLPPLGRFLNLDPAQP